MQTLTLTPLFRESIGFDRFNDLFESVLNGQDHDRNNTYPPYNIEKHGDNNYRITMAVAGFKLGDLNIITQDNVLTVSGEIKNEHQESVEYLHKGIAARAFQHRFNLSDYMEVKGANLTDGLLQVDLVREVPEASKPKMIEIKSNSAEPQAMIEDKSTDKKKAKLVA